MSKVDTASVSKKPVGEKDEAEKYKCVNASCGKVFDKPMKFCPGCGQSQQ
jgi:rRNA maturation endonuclease Nob1